ncbi:uncharacterized protein [Apostichopus japonicus]|uniref:uncharacterized protein isoform X2 n=1 Tax=Stichopus japonicus TaxID=307972 RepID=UPI003AB75008
MLPLHLYDGMRKVKAKKKSNNAKTANCGGGKHRRHEGQHNPGSHDSDKKIERYPLSVSLDDLQRQNELALRDEEDKRNKDMKCDFQHHSKDQSHSKKRRAPSLGDEEEAIDLSRVSRRKKWTVVICFFGFCLSLVVILILVFKLAS